MNIYTKAWTMGTKRVVLSLLAISNLGLVALPARADNAIIQESLQESINTGKGNTSIQNSYQESQIRRDRRGRGNGEVIDTGVVQRNDQYCDQAGRNNLCVQNSNQHNRIRYRHGR